MNKILWFDVETGGTNEKTDALIQLSALAEINGEIVEEIDLKMKPVQGKKVSFEAISKHGMTMDMINSFESPADSFENFYSFLQRNGGAPSKLTRYIMAGYNPEFDCRFLSEWFQDITGGPYKYWDYCQFSPLDVLTTLRAMRYHGVINIPDTKLETVCKYFGIEIKAHDALSDIKATRELTKLVFGKLFKGWN